jgi:hypothetical protein
MSKSKSQGQSKAVEDPILTSIKDHTLTKTSKEPIAICILITEMKIKIKLVGLYIKMTKAMKLIVMANQ